MLLPFATALPEADATLPARLDAARLREIVGGIPEDWLEAEPGIGGPDAVREAYVAYLLSRLDAPRAFVEEAIHARS